MRLTLQNSNLGNYENKDIFKKKNGGNGSPVFIATRLACLSDVTILQLQISAVRIFFTY